MEQPELGEAGALCVAAWRDLDSERTMTAMTIGLGGSALVHSPIPWSEIRDWCEWNGLGKDETRIVVFVLRRLDDDRAKKEAARIQELARQASGK